MSASPIASRPTQPDANAAVSASRITVTSLLVIRLAAIAEANCLEKLLEHDRHVKLEFGYEAN